MFNSEEEAMRGHLRGQIKPGDVVVIRYEGPKGGPGMREMLTPTTAICGMGLDKAWRLSPTAASPAPQGPGHRPCKPRGAAGGPIAPHRGGRPVITIDIEGGKLTLDVSDEELAARRAAFVPPAPKITTACSPSTQSSFPAQTRERMSHDEHREKLDKQLAIEGKPFGPGSHTAHEGKTMTGAQAIIASLEAEGVDTVFGYPGGQAIENLRRAVRYSKQMHHVLARHEQGASHAADGYARATGKVGVVLVTSGPGATNTVTGIATAYMDSIPHGGSSPARSRAASSARTASRNPTSPASPCPWSRHTSCCRTDDLAARSARPSDIASTGRPGPVLIDIPSDLSRRRDGLPLSRLREHAQYKPTYQAATPSKSQAAELIDPAERPLIYVGGGIVNASHACSRFRSLPKRYADSRGHHAHGKGRHA